MPQLTYQDQRELPAFEGGLYDTGPYDIVSRTPGGNVKQLSTLVIVAATTAAVAQVATFTVDTAADGDNFRISIGEFEFVGVSAGTDVPTQVAAIKALMDANEDFLALYTTGGASPDIIVTARRPGTPFAVAETVDATSAYSWVEETTANTDGTQFKFTIDGHELLYAAASTTPETERDALLALLQADAFFALEVVFVSVSTNSITIEALTAGNPHTITFENEDGIGRAGITASETFVATTPNVTGQPIPFGRGLTRTAVQSIAVLPSSAGFVFEGVSVNRAKARPRDNTGSTPVTGDAEYRGDEAVPTMRKGRIWVIPETAVDPSLAVYLRHTVDSGDATLTPGRFRSTDVGAEVDLIEVGARWITEADAETLAVLEVDIPASVMA